MTTRPADFHPTGRTRVRRNPGRGAYDRQTVYDILDAGLMCHVGYSIEDQPYVTSTAYWRDGDHVYWHGSAASRMLKEQAEGVPVCFTVAHFDGLVMARSAFHHSVNYRSVVAFGTSEPILDEGEKLRQLERFMERIAPGRWGDVREPSSRELRLTTLMSLKLDEVVAKIRNGPPVDDDGDYGLPVWAGTVPLRRTAMTPVPDDRMTAATAAPAYMADLQID